ncbi:MAG: DUF2680 domain-containing protein [Firmicutes bacterium]|nr:DUF2680 domain-containing protein [Bacillota bacterium]
MKKATILILSAILALIGVLPVWAADSGLSALTEAYVQRLEAEKRYLDALAEAGKLTPEQAERLKQNLDSRIEYLKSDDFDPSKISPWGQPGFRRGVRYFGRPMGRFGGRMMGSGWWCGACPCWGVR